LALTLGGDHSLAMATLSGSAAAYGDIAVVWVDAHAVRLLLLLFFPFSFSPIFLPYYIFYTKFLYMKNYMITSINSKSVFSFSISFLGSGY